MNILVTGGTGYLGSHVVHRLCEDSHRVLCLILRGDPCVRLSDLSERIQYIYTDAPDLYQAMERFSADAVIHMASVYERGGVELPAVFDANLSFPFAVLQYAIEAGIRKWVNTGSALPAGLNGYSLSKSQFVQWGKLEASRGRIDFINLQLEHFYGADAPETHFLAWVTKKLKRNEPIDLTAGTQHRDFVYVDDVVNAISAMLTCPVSGYTEVPVGTGEAPSIREVVTYLKEISGSTSELRFGTVPTRTGEPESDIDLTVMKAFHISCAYSWRDGMKKLI